MRIKLRILITLCLFHLLIPFIFNDEYDFKDWNNWKLEIIFFKIKRENKNIQKSSKIHRNYTQDINKLKFFTTRIGKKVKVLIGFARLKMIHRRGRLSRITYDYYYTFIRIFHFVSVLGLFKKLCFIIELSIYVIHLYLPVFFCLSMIFFFGYMYV